MTPSTHLSVLDGIKDPDRRSAAWARFQDRYQPAIHRWCLARGLQPADADDLTQAVLVKLLHALPGYEHDPARGRFRSYLATVVTTTVIDFARSRANRPDGRAVGGTAFQERLADLPSPAACGELADSIGTAADVDADLRRVVEAVRAAVEPRTWQAFERLTAYDHDAKSVAADLGMTLGAVYQAKYRVRDLLNREYAARIADPNAAPEDRP